MKRLSLLALLLVAACSAPSEDDSDTAESAYGGWPLDPSPDCNAERDAVKGLEADGFVRTTEVKTPISVGGNQHDGYTYKDAIGWRYEHADGRVQYALCHGRVGPKFPVKNVAVDIPGTWTGVQLDPWKRKTPLTNKPAGTLHFDLQDFVVYPLNLDVVTNQKLTTPLTHSERKESWCKGPNRWSPSYRCMAYVNTPITFDQEGATWSWEVGNEQIDIAMKAPTGEEMDARVKFDANGKVIEAVVHAYGPWQQWTFTGP